MRLDRANDGRTRLSELANTVLVTVVGAGGLLYFALLTALVGNYVGYRLGPDHRDVGAAVDSLVPPGFAVTERTLAPVADAFCPPPDYCHHEASLDLTGGPDDVAGHDELVEAVRSHAQRAGWRVVQERAVRGIDGKGGTVHTATVLHVARPPFTAEIHLGVRDRDHVVFLEEDELADAQRAHTGFAVGATAGVALAGVLVLKRVRHWCGAVD